MNSKKNHAKFRWWMLTYNNPQGCWKTILSNFKADYAIGQLEQGTEGTIHIQAILWFREPKRPSFWKDIPCWSKGLSSEDAADRVQAYCSKEETRIEGPFEYGTKPFKRNSKTDWAACRKAAEEGRFDEIAAEVFIPYYSNLKKIHAEKQTATTSDDVRGIWIYGLPGVGKTHYARHIFPNHYVKAQNKWFDGYQGQQTIIIDDFDKNGSCLSHYLKIWADKWAAYGEIKGAMVPLQHRNFVITSNYLPEDLWKEDSVLLEAIQRRFYFVNIVSRDDIRTGASPGQLPVTSYQFDLISWLDLPIKDIQYFK